MWRSRPGTWPPPAPPTRPAWTSVPGWPPPTPPTPNGSGTCRSATKRLGDVAIAAGDLAAARAAYQASLDIRTRLAAADPANTQWQRDLSVSHDRLGDVARAAGDLAAARAAYQAAWTSAAGWPPPTPPTPNGSGTCRSATNKLGDVATAAGDLAAARTAYQASPGHRRAAGRRRPRQHRLAARPGDHAAEDRRSLQFIRNLTQAFLRHTPLLPSTASSRTSTSLPKVVITWARRSVGTASGARRYEHKRLRIASYSYTMHVWQPP